MGKLLLFLLGVILLILAGCGGGGGNSPSVPDTENSEMSNENTMPIANAGINQFTTTGSTVSLDGHNSFDADGDFLTYAWSFASLPFESQATLSDESDINPSFVADIDGEYVVWLTVNDGIQNSTVDSVIIRSGTPPLPVPDTPVPERYSVDPDLSFGIDGRIISDAISYPVDVLVQDDEKIVIIGSRKKGDYNEIVLSRYDEDGAIDYEFGSDGITELSFDNKSVMASAAKLLDDGRIIVAGTTEGFESEIVLSRYQTNGSRDLTFGTNGVVLTNLVSVRVASLLVQSDNKYIVSGAIGVMDDNSSMIHMRYHENGQLDTDYGNNGIVFTTINSRYNEVYASAIQPDDKIVSVGTGVGTFNSPVLIRYNVDGSFDSTFGVNGIVESDNTKSSIASDLIIQADGTILVLAGWELARYNPDGSVDESYGNSGVFDPEKAINSIYGSLLVQSDGKVLVSGWYSYIREEYLASGGGLDGDPEYFDRDFALIRVNQPGSIDDTFGKGGLVTLDLHNNENEYISAMRMQSDNKIIAVGPIYDIEMFGMVRFYQ